MPRRIRAAAHRAIVETLLQSYENTGTDTNIPKGYYHLCIPINGLLL